MTAANSNERQKHASTILMGGKPVSVGINVSRNNPKYVQFGSNDGSKKDIYSQHAERVAIRRAGNCDGGVLYVVRLAGGKGSMSMPCNFCMKAIITAGIKKIYFTIDNDKIGIIKV